MSNATNVDVRTYPPNDYQSRKRKEKKKRNKISKAKQNSNHFPKRNEEGIRVHTWPMNDQDYVLRLFAITQH